METRDVMGHRPDRHNAFSFAMLSEAEDEELTAIVQDAARELGTPIALVNLVLDHIQFFKAHYGLPTELAVARGTDRDVSFCQFVVSTGQPFEVTDARNDERVPKRLVNDYNIQAYLGYPVIAGEVIVGSLCVIDTQPRQFTDDDRRNLQELASVVNRRLESLLRDRERTRAVLIASSAGPAIVELRDSFSPIRTEVDAARLAMKALGPFMRLAEYALSGQAVSLRTLRQALETARSAIASCENSFYNIEAAAADAEDSLQALENVTMIDTRARLSEVALSGRELARRNFRPVGGAFLPEFEFDPFIAAPRPIAIASVAHCLTLLADELVRLDSRCGIRMGTNRSNGNVAITFQAADLPADSFNNVAIDLNRHVGQDPTIRVIVDEQEISLLFTVLRSDPATKEK